MQDVQLSDAELKLNQARRKVIIFNLLFALSWIVGYFLGEFGSRSSDPAGRGFSMAFIMFLLIGLMYLAMVVTFIRISSRHWRQIGRKYQLLLLSPLTVLLAIAAVILVIILD